MLWLFFALGSALFAGLTAILAKIGIENVNSTLATALRTVVVLRFYEDMPLGDIARVTSTNLNTVKSRLYKALAELRRDMAGETQTAGKV